MELGNDRGAGNLFLNNKNRGSNSILLHTEYPDSQNQMADHQNSCFLPFIQRTQRAPIPFTSFMYK